MTSALPPLPLRTATSWQALTRSSVLSLSADEEAVVAAGALPHACGSSTSLASPTSAASLDPIDSVWSWSDDGVADASMMAPPPFYSGAPLPPPPPPGLYPALPLLPPRPGGAPVPYYTMLTVTPPPSSLKRVRSAGLDVVAVGGFVAQAAALTPPMWHGASPASPSRSPTRSPAKSPSKRPASKAGPPPCRAHALTLDTLPSHLPSLPSSVHLPCGAVATLELGVWRAADGSVGARVVVALAESSGDAGARLPPQTDDTPDTPTTTALRDRTDLAHALVTAFNPRCITTGMPVTQRRAHRGARPGSARRRWPAACDLRTQELFFVKQKLTPDEIPTIFHSPHRGAVGGSVAATPPWREGATIFVVARVPDGEGGELWLKSEGVWLPPAGGV